MKILGVMNGWRDAPHCWWRYILLPFFYDKTPMYHVVSIFGFAFSIDFRR